MGRYNITKEAESMKKLFPIFMALVLTLALFAIPVMAEEETDDGGAIGFLSFLNMSEEEVEARRIAEVPAYQYLVDHEVMVIDEPAAPLETTVFYDSLDAMLLGLLSGEVSALSMPDCTAKYLTNVNDQVRQSIIYYPEKAEGFSKVLLNHLCNGYSFMMLEENSDLRDQFDQVTEEMRSDGTLEELIRIHITDVSEGGEPEVVVFEEFEGDPIRIAVTGSLPPMDYVSEDGTAAGFNTAVLAEIGKRLGRNIELVQVDSLGRALALAQGNVDAVFWTRSTSGGMIDSGLPELSQEDFAAHLQEVEADRTDEENAIMNGMRETTSREELIHRDMPEGTVVTKPYYTDMNVVVVLK